MKFLSEIREAGFVILLNNNDLTVSPASNLSVERRRFLKANKQKIIAELKSEKATFSIIESLKVTCFSPLNNPILVQAENQDHAKFLKKMNPQIEAKS